MGRGSPPASAEPFSGSSFSGTFTIPRFKDCGLLTPVLNLLLPGSGNTISATATP
jgi:hypothetical protein